MSQDSAYRPRLMIDGVEALNLVSARYSTAINSNISNFSATIDSPDLQESTLFGKKVKFFLNYGSEDGLPLFEGFIKQVQPSEKNIKITAFDVRSFLTENSTTLNLTDEHNFDGHNLSSFLKSYITDNININKTLIDVNKINSMNPPVNLTGLRGDFNPYELVKELIDKSIDLTDIQEPLNYFVDVIGNSIIFVKSRRLDSTPSISLSQSNGLISYRYNQRPKKFTANYMNRRFTYGTSPNGTFSIDYQGTEEFPAEKRQMAYLQIVRELQSTKELTLTTSLGHYIGLGSIVYLNTEDKNIAGAHRVVSKSISCSKNSISLDLGVNKSLPNLSKYLSQ